MYGGARQKENAETRLLMSPLSPLSISLDVRAVHILKCLLCDLTANQLRSGMPEQTQLLLQHICMHVCEQRPWLTHCRRTSGDLNQNFCFTTCLCLKVKQACEPRQRICSLCNCCCFLPGEPDLQIPGKQKGGTTFSHIWLSLSCNL